MMSEKRFILVEDSNGLFSIFDNEDIECEPIIYGARFGTEKIVDLLNEFNDENKELKKENEQLRNELDSFKPVMFQDMRYGTVTLYSKGGIDE